MRRALEYWIKPVYKALDHTASRYPDRVGFVDFERGEYTYSHVRHLSDFLGAQLLNDGLHKGDRVLVLLPNSIEFIVSFYGIQKAGGVVVPLNTLHTDSEVRKYVEIVEPTAVIVDSALYKSLPCLRDLDRFSYIFPTDGRSFFNRLEDQKISRFRPAEINVFEDLAVLPFSSGTTGLPKGVCLTHSNLYCNMQQIIDGHELVQNDVFINHLPYFHIYGMNVLMGCSIFLGAKQVILRGLDPEKLLSAVQRYKGSVFFTVPAALNHLVKHCELTSKDLSSLRFLNIGGGPLVPEVGSTFSSATGVTVNQAYGLTESSPTTHANPLCKIKHESIGLPVADTFMKIVDIHTLDPLPPGQRGELWVKGPQIMKGYFRNPEATRSTLVDGWLRTGDIAWRDEEGYTYIVDRLKELIKYKSYQVPPAELENLIMELKGVTDCAVVGKPDEEAGELPIAFVAAEDRQLTEEAVKEHVASRVAPYKKIREVRFTDNIPRSASGKILRRVLREMYFSLT